MMTRLNAFACLAAALAAVYCTFSASAAPNPSAAAPTPPILPLPTAAPAPPKPVASVPMRLVAGKFVVDAYLDGHGPFAIAIDSGAETLSITQHVARACGFTLRHGTVAVTGTQSQTALGVAQAMVGAIRIGNASVARPFCTVSPVPLPVDGYIGAPLLNAFVTEIDPHTRMVRLYRPDSFAAVAVDTYAEPAEESAPAIPIANESASPVSGQQIVVADPAAAAPANPGNPSKLPPTAAPAGIGMSQAAVSGAEFGVPIPITLGFHRVPVVQGTLGSIPARLEIDTGSAFPAELTARFTHANNLAHRFDRMGNLRLQSGGVVGFAGVYALDDLTLGDAGQSANAAFDKGNGNGNGNGAAEANVADSVGGGDTAEPVLASLKGTIPTVFLASTAPPGSSSSTRPEQYDGRIGAPLLVQFAITFDYARSRILMRPIVPTSLRLPHISR